ncbi:DUF6746 family protein [Luteimonas dalianensis]
MRRNQTRRRIFRIAIFAAAVGFASAAGAQDERISHYSGEPADSTAQALANLAGYNARLQALLAEDEVDLHTVHELTYTLENALQRLQADLAEAAEALEEVHLASEAADADTVKSRGGDYLEVTRPLVE